MIRTNDEYWDFDRASFDDELDAWRERTATRQTVMAGPLAAIRTIELRQSVIASAYGDVATLTRLPTVPRFVASIPLMAV